MVMYHMFASGVGLGANTLRICSVNGPTVCAGCAKDDSIEIIKRSDYGMLKMVENNSVLRLNARFCFRLCPFPTIPIFPICPLSVQRNR